MLRVALKQLLSHKLRLALTALAVALGVSFVAGTFVLSDTMAKAFDGLYAGLSKGTDVTVRSASAYSSVDSMTDTRPVPASLLAAVTKVDGVAGAEGGVSGYALIVDKKGKPVLPGGAPTLGTGYFDDRALAGGFSLRSGRAPHGPHELVLDAGTAKKTGYKVGDSVPVVFQSGRGVFTVVGIAGFGEADNLLGATLATFDTRTAQQLLGRTGQYDDIRVRAQAGVSAAELRDRIARVLPKDVEAVTSTDLTAEQSKATRDGLQFFTTVLLGFAMVSLLVGAFLIWNTFSVLVAQRTRETALLRAVGARRSQVLAGVVVEALVVGTVSSAVGLALGVGLASGLRALLHAVGIDVPTTAIALEPRTVWVTFAVGILVTVVSALVPARAATKVAPIAALRESSPAEKAPSRWRTVIGLVLTGLGAALLVTASVGKTLALVGTGVLAAFVGLVVLGPDLARLTARLVRGRRPAGWGMAARTIGRSPRRSATTALALTIGLALVSAVTVTAASTKASVADVLERTSKADLIIKSASQASPGFTPQVAETVRAQKGVDTVVELRFSMARLGGQGTAVAGVSDGVDKVADLQMKTGALSDLGAGTVIVSTKEAMARGTKLGDTVRITFPSTGEAALRVVGTYANDGLIGAGYLLSLGELGTHVSSRLDVAVLAKADRGADLAALKKSVTTALAPYPGVTVDDPGTFVRDQAKSVDQLLGIVTALLLLAVVVALLGIINTLALSVLERTRELGLMRAVGAQRRQVTALVRREAVLMAGLGAVVGIVLGTGAGVALARGLADLGLSVVDVPWTRLAVYLLAALVAGVVAAVGPGRRAAKVDVLRAVTAE